jgi:hypothetical protein
VVDLPAFGLDLPLFVFIHLLDHGSRLASPVVCIVVAGGLSLGTQVCPGGVVAGRVAVVLGGSL